MVLGKLYTYTSKKEGRPLHLIPHRKRNSKWTKDVNIRTKALQAVEENISLSLPNL